MMRNNGFEVQPEREQKQRKKINVGKRLIERENKITVHFKDGKTEKEGRNDTRKKEVQNKYKIGEDEYKNSENLVRKKSKKKM